MKEGKRLYLIYGYREIAPPHRWYVGATEYIREKKRDKEHRFPQGYKTVFSKFVKLKYKDGLSFDDILEKVNLEYFYGTKEEADQRETFHTERLDAEYPNGFVMRVGGYRGRHNAESKSKMSKSHKGKVISKATREKISKINKGMPKPKSKETRAKISSTLKGKYTGSKNPFYGKKHSKETKAKLSKARKGMKLPKQWRERISKALIGNQYARKNKRSSNGQISFS